MKGECNYERKGTRGRILKLAKKDLAERGGSRVKI